jgi:hypothetical protein
MNAGITIFLQSPVVLHKCIAVHYHNVTADTKFDLNYMLHSKQEWDPLLGASENAQIWYRCSAVLVRPC